MTGQEIADSINLIIEEMIRERKMGDKKKWEDEAINWADLKVKEIHEVAEIYPDDSKNIEVLIEEADQSALGFCCDVEYRFYQRHGFFIEVLTAW